MGEDISYDFIWRFLQKEKQTNQIISTSRNFYLDLNEFVKKQTNEQNKINAEKLVGDIFTKRKQKILLYITYGKQLPQPISDNEMDFYINVSKIINDYKINNVLNTYKLNVLQFISDIPEIIIPSGKKLGPYKKGDTVNFDMDGSDIEYLLKNKICEAYNR